MVGNLIRQTNGEGETTSTGYDAQGRVTSETDGNGDLTRFRHDSEGNLRVVIDAAQNKTVYTYDGLNREKTETIYNQITPLPARANTYNNAGNLAQVVDRSGRVRKFDYDTLDRLRFEKWGYSGTDVDVLEWRYDDLGRVTYQRNGTSGTLPTGAGGMSINSPMIDTFTYDGLGRLIEQTNYDGTSAGGPLLKQTYQYVVVDSSGSFTDDVIRTQAAVQFPFTGTDVPIAKTVTRYDRLGQLSSVTDSNEGGDWFFPATKQLQFTYDVAGNLSGIARRLDQGGWVSMAPTTYAYDRANRLTSMTHDVATDIIHAYAYDNASRVTSFNTTGSGTASRGYGYDDAGQLISGANESYTYDDNGNRKLVGSQPITTVFGNRLKSDGTYDYVYDSEGNLIQKLAAGTPNVLVAYGWDYRNRLVSFTDYVANPDIVITYAYDASDRRVKRALDADGGTPSFSNEYFVYDGQELVMRFDHGQELTHRYLHGPATDQALVDEVFSQGGGSGERTSYEVLWQLADHQGTIRDIVDGAGTFRKHVDYDSFGKITSEQTYGAAIDQLFGFQGQEWDADAKLQNNNARWYDPKMGRFISEDPSGFDGGDANMYRYVGNDPINHTDPTGFYQAGNPISSLYKNTGSNALADLANSGQLKVTSTPLSRVTTSAKIPLQVDRSLIGSPVAKLPAGINQLDQILLKAERGETLHGGEKSLAQLLYYTKDADALRGRALPDVSTRMALAGIPVAPARSNTGFPISSPGSGALARPATIDDLQSGFDVAGLSPDPIIGTGADAINAFISLGRGNFVNAGLSAVSIVPLVGDLIGKGGKLASKLAPGTSGRVGSGVYDVGLAMDLRRNPFAETQVNHAPQSRHAESLIGDFKSVNKVGHEPAIRLSMSEHEAVSAAQALRRVPASARELLADEIRILRNNTNAPNSALQELIELSRGLHRYDYEPLHRVRQ